MIRFFCGNHAINDHCWLGKSSLAVASGNLIKFYEFKGLQWVSTLVLGPLSSIILKISYCPERINDIDSGYLAVSGLQTLAAISLSDYKYSEFNSDFWILNFIRVNKIIVVGASDLSVTLLKFPELQVIKSFPGRQFCLATSLGLSLVSNRVDLIFTTIKSIHHFTLSLDEFIITESGIAKTLHRGIVFKSKFVFSGRYILTASEDRSVIVWSFPGFDAKIVLDHPVKVWDGISLHNLEREVIATCDSTGNIYFWDMQGNLLETFSTRDSAPITNLSTFGGCISFGSRDGNVRVRSISNGCESREFKFINSKDWIKSICSFDGTFYILTNNGHVYSMKDDVIRKLSVPNYLTKISKNRKASGNNIAKLVRKLSKLKGDLSSYRNSNLIPTNIMLDRFNKTLNKFNSLIIRLEKCYSKDFDLANDLTSIGDLTREIFNEKFLTREAAINVNAINEKAFNENAINEIIKKRGGETLTLAIVERIGRLEVILAALEGVIRSQDSNDAMSSDYLEENVVLEVDGGGFASSALSVSFNLVCVGDLNGQVHIFPVKYDRLMDEDYKVFKCFQHRVGSIYYTDNESFICVDNLGNVSTIEVGKLDLCDKYVDVKSHKLPFSKRYGKITSCTMISDIEIVVLGDEFGNLYYGKLSNMLRMKAHNDKITCIKPHDDRIFTTSTDGVISQWGMDFRRLSDMKIEHLQHIYDIAIDNDIHVLGFTGRTAVYYNLSGKIDLWNHDCGGPRRPLHLTKYDKNTIFAYGIGNTLRVFTCNTESTHSINPWFPYDDLYSGIWINNDLLIGGRDCYMRLLSIPGHTPLTRTNATNEKDLTREAAINENAINEKAINEKAINENNFLENIAINERNAINVKAINEKQLASKRTPRRPFIVECLRPMVTSPFKVMKAIPFPCPIRSICRVEGYIVVGGAGAIKLYDNNLIELDSSSLSDEDELLQIRVNAMAYIRREDILLACGLSNSTVHLYKITDIPNMVLIERIILESTPLSMASTDNGIIIGTNRGFIRVIELDAGGYTERTGRIHQNGINGIVLAGENIITCGDDQQMVITDIMTLEIKFVTGVTNSIRCIGLASNYIFTSGWDLTLRVWKMVDCELKEVCKTTLVTRPRSIVLKNHQSGSVNHIIIAVLGQGGSFELFSFDELSNEIETID